VPLVDLHHPFHLHGYDFFVMAMDQFRNGETLESISNKLLETNFRRSTLPARKDTITVPSNGYAAIRFRANNPGEAQFHRNTCSICASSVFEWG
jgi:FtsP/CotA-like multicopper oxidase with cupredoxin domain